MGRRLRALGRGLGILLLPIVLFLLKIILMIAYVVLLIASLIGWVIGLIDILIELITGKPSHIGQGIQDGILNAFRSINEWCIRKLRWFWTGEVEF